MFSKVEFAPLGFRSAPPLSERGPVTEQRWECAWFSHVSNSVKAAKGIVVTTFPDLHTVQLMPLEGDLGDRADLNGAPVAIEGELAGIITNISIDGRGVGSLLMVPLSEMVRSDSGKLIHELRHQQLLNRLDPLARQAVARASGISETLSQDAIHMEHLIAGLYDGEPWTSAHTVFNYWGLERPELLRLIRRAVGSEVPAGYPVRELTALPPLSAHVREAFEKAWELAQKRSSASVIDSRFLLYGALSVESCRVTQELLNFSERIRKERIDLTEPAERDQREADDAENDSIQISSISDAPAEDDSLGFKPYVEAIARFLTSKDTKPPLTLSIEGEWGSGKSSFMLQLRKTLKGGLHVQFNPWRHDKAQSLWAAFALEFLRQISTQRSVWRRLWAWLELSWAHYGWLGRVQFLRAALMWLILAFMFLYLPYEILVNKPQWSRNVLAVLSEKDSKTDGEKKQRSDAAKEAATRGGGVKGDEPKEKEKDLDPIVGWLVGIGGLAGYLAVVISIWIKAKDLIGNPLEIDLKKYLRSPDYEEQVTFVERFHEDFKRIVDAYAGDRKVFVFIDDLDRCDVPRAAELMKAVNLLIADDPRLIFILGMDRDKVAAGLAVKFEKLLPYLANHSDGPETHGWRRQTGLEFGHSFLQKFIQLPFRVPQPNLDHYESFLETISPAGPSKGTHGVNAVKLVPRNDATALVGMESGSAPAAPVAANQAATVIQAPSMPAATPVQKEARIRRELQFTGDSEQVREIAMMVARTIDRNPRRLKQFINLFRLQAYIVNELGFLDDTRPTEQRITLQQLGKFVVVTLKWPALLADFAETRSCWRSYRSLPTAEMGKRSSQLRRDDGSRRSASDCC